MHSSSSPSHPVGLYVLCAVEAAAGFALYILSAVLLLYLIETRELDEQTALRWVGGYNAATFIAPLFGGALADAWLRFRRTVLLGAVCLMLGFFVLSLGRDPRWGLVILLLGNGLFRSNAVAMLGRLYADADPRLDVAYRLLYAAFNFGGLVAPPIAGMLAEAGRWKGAFLLAATAMGFAALLVYCADPQLAHADERSREASGDTPVRCASGTGARWLAICVIAQVAMLWALAYGQADGVMLLWARDYTRRAVLGVEISPSAFISVPPLFVLLWTALAAVVGKRSRSPTRYTKILAGLLATAIGFALMILAIPQRGQRTSAAWPLACLALLTIGELLVVPLTQSLITRLAPHSHVGLSYALWYAATALGLFLAGQLGARWGSISHAIFFALLSAAPLSAAGLLACQRSYLRVALRRVERWSQSGE